MGERNRTEEQWRKEREMTRSVKGVRDAERVRACSRKATLQVTGLGKGKLAKKKKKKTVKWNSEQHVKAELSTHTYTQTLTHTISISVKNILRDCNSAQCSFTISSGMLVIWVKAYLWACLSGEACAGISAVTTQHCHNAQFHYTRHTFHSVTLTATHLQQHAHTQSVWIVEVD